MMSYPLKSESEKQSASHGGKHYGEINGDFGGAGFAQGFKVAQGLLMLVHGVALS
jgi:hypothetical protein